MRKILIVGAGQSGLQLALGLQSKGYEITLMSNRTSDEIRGGRVMSTQCMFHTALDHERDLELNFWEERAPRVEGLGVSVAGPPASEGRAHPRVIDWVGRLDGHAQSVDQRIKMAGWMETFEQRGGQVVIHGAAVSDLDVLDRKYDLALVAAGKGELVSLFGRDAARSPYDNPRRALAVAYVHGLGPRPEHPGLEAVRCNLVPGVGELFVMPALTTTGRADILFWEGVPGGPADVFQGITDPSEHLARVLELMERFTPWEYARATKVELTDAGGTLSGGYAPTVRNPIGRLPAAGWSWASPMSWWPTTRSPGRAPTPRPNARRPIWRASSSTATGRSTRSGCGRPSTATGRPRGMSPSGPTPCWARRRSTS
ncbi:hypothetical protein GCM10017744_039100 [Streptomyces antimycoticus]